MNISENKTIVIRYPKTISNGLIVSQEAFIELDVDNMRSDFIKMFQYYYATGQISVKVAEIK
jgi:hypothetical protein